MNLRITINGFGRKQLLPFKIKLARWLPIQHFVIFYEAKKFCAWLTAKERKERKIGPNDEYRLPRDEEWSAAVGTGKFPWGNQWPPPPGAGNYDPVFKTDDYKYTSPVGSFKANQYGLYDMGGNVWQWCEDWYRRDMNDKALLDNSMDDEGGMHYRLVRGLSWEYNVPDHLLSSYRQGGAPDYRDEDYGFRCVLVHLPFSR